MISNLLANVRISLKKVFKDKIWRPYKTFISHRCKLKKKYKTFPSIKKMMDDFVAFIELC